MKGKLLSLAASAASMTAIALAMNTTAPAPAQAGVCPVIVDHSGGGGTTTDCNVLLTINANGSVTATDPSGTTTYDGSDDAMIGILNNTSSTLNHFLIHGSSAFGGSFGGMDGDGICETSRFTGANCTGAPQNTTFDYAPAGVTFTPISATDGFVDIAGGLAAGQSFYFSLEAPASLSSITLTVPAPEPVSVALLGSALVGIGLVRRRRTS